MSLKDVFKASATLAQPATLADLGPDFGALGPDQADKSLTDILAQAPPPAFRPGR